MKLGLLPLFKPEHFKQGAIQASGLEYFAAHALSEIVPFIQQTFDNVFPVIGLELKSLASKHPDVILLWSTSACFELASGMAESIKAYLDIPVWLAGPHISYLPQSLPAAVDVGIIGEVEVPLKQLLELYLKQPDATSAHYRRIPGIVYQSQGRMYSGTPGQMIADLNQLPTPNYRFWLDFPGFSAPVIRTARIQDNLLTALAYAPTRKSRQLSSASILKQLEQIVANYTFLFQSLPLEAHQRMYFSPVFIADQQLLAFPERLKELQALILERKLHQQIFFILSAAPEQLTPGILKQLKAMNVRKLMFQLAPFGHQNKLLSQASPERLSQVLLACKEIQIDVLGLAFLNPEPQTSRQQMARFYLYLQDHHHLFERLQTTLMAPIPGTPMWDAYAKNHKPDITTLERMPWHAMDWENISPELPLYHTQLRGAAFHEIYDAFARLGKEKQGFMGPHQGDIIYWGRAVVARSLAREHFTPTDQVLEVVLQPETACKPFLEGYQIQQLHIRQGQLHGEWPAQPLDMLLLPGSLNGLRSPLEALKQLSQSLKPGGKVFLSVVNPLCIYLLLKFLDWPVKYSQQHYPVLRWITQPQLEDMVKTCQLEILNIGYTQIEEIDTVRPLVHNLSQHIEHFSARHVPQHLLYTSEIKLLARKL